jgi:flagellar biosynthesis protein FlhB
MKRKSNLKHNAERIEATAKFIIISSLDVILEKMELIFRICLKMKKQEIEKEIRKDVAGKSVKTTVEH